MKLLNPMTMSFREPKTARISISVVNFHFERCIKVEATEISALAEGVRPCGAQTNSVHECTVKRDNLRYSFMTHL